ncbi:MAG: hypothetical protein AAF677_04405 [Pseudomonadota bacterium]
MTKTLKTLTLAAALTAFALPAAAYHGSCDAMHPTGSTERCITRTTVDNFEPGVGGFQSCESGPAGSGDVQYDYYTVFAGTAHYICSHYHTCSQVQSVDPNSYAAFCP